MLGALYLARREEAEPIIQCESEETSTDTYFGLRIASIFVIFVGSLLGAIAPILLHRANNPHRRRAEWVKWILFACKYTGSGVIIATAWMHLLSPAVEALGDPCLKPLLGDYDWVMAIALMTIMVMFLIELVVAHYDVFGSGGGHSHGHDAGHSPLVHGSKTNNSIDSVGVAKGVTDSAPQGALAASAPAQGLSHDIEAQIETKGSSQGPPQDINYPPGGNDHLGHQREHSDGHDSIAAQMTSIFILEFGVIFHSVFIGLTLAVSEEFIVLFIVLVFHQTFEGLGLGSRLATLKWPQNKRMMPYLLGIGYSVSTPIAIAIGLGVRNSFQPGSSTSRIVNGVFDSVSAGILMYTGLVELLAHEFMFNPEMRRAGLGMQLKAFGCVCFGAGVMAALANWA